MSRKGKKIKRTKAGREKGSSESSKSSNFSGFLIFGFIILAVFGLTYFVFSLKGSSGKDIDYAVALPDYAYVSERSKQAYTVSRIPEVGNAMEYTPCYCGCVGIGHRYLKDCFSGEHGAYCDLCQYEALDVYNLLKQGKSLKEIRNYIDLTYGNGRFGPGTNTPMP